MWTEIFYPIKTPRGICRGLWPSSAVHILASQNLDLDTDTLSQTNGWNPKSWRLEDGFPFQRGDFQVPAVRFREGKPGGLIFETTTKNTPTACKYKEHHWTAWTKETYAHLLPRPAGCLWYSTMQPGEMHPWDCLLLNVTSLSIETMQKMRSTKCCIAVDNKLDLSDEAAYIICASCKCVCFLRGRHVGSKQS